MIDIEKINERKEVLGKDIEMIRARIAESQKKVAEDQAMLNALMGAFQQCDAFVKELDNDEADKDSSASDVENSPEED